MKPFADKEVGHSYSWRNFWESSLIRYYLYGLLPSLALHFLLFLLEAHLFNIMLSALGFLWPYALMTPRMKERVQHQRYRYSFLRFSFFFHQMVENLPAPSLSQKWKKVLADLSLPLLVGLFWSVFTSVANPFFPLIGWACWFLFLRLQEKFQLGLIETS